MSDHSCIVIMGKEIKCEACRAFYRLFATRLNRGTNVKLYSS